MKNLKFFALMAMTIMMGVSFTACEDDDASITITVDGEVLTDVTVGESQTHEYTVVSDNKIESINYYLNNTPEAVDEDDIENYSYQGSFTYEATTVGTDYISIEVTDKDGNVESKDYTITVSAAPGEINTYSATLLGSYESTTGSFFATSTGTVYTQSNAKTNSSLIDFVYYYGTSNSATIAAPDDSDAESIYDNASTGLETWTTQNSTKFAMSSVTSSEFDDIEDDELISEEENVTSSAATQLEEGDVVAFTTAAGKKGLFKVTSIEGTTAGTITITVKVQE
jgi:hypothetical protein